MKFWLSIVTVPEVDQYIEIARFAEEVGFHGITIADHLVMPTQIEKSRYPYTEDGKMWWPDDTPWPDPWVTLATMGAATSTLKLATNIYLAALRDPFTAARAVSTTSAFTGGRAVFGVSAGWIEEEYEIAGIDFKSRGRRLDEVITVAKKLWTGESVSHEGEFFNFKNALMSPKPAGKVPVWCGGASKPALRRAARNDGWLGVPMMIDQLQQTVDFMMSVREEEGLSDQPFDIMASLLEPLTPENQQRLHNMGVEHNAALPWLETPWGRSPWVMEGEDTSDLNIKKKVLERFANDLIHK